MQNKKFLVILIKILEVKVCCAHVNKLSPISQQTYQESLKNVTCQLVKELLSKHSHTQDVLIGNLDEKIQSKVINGIVECIGYENPIIIADMKADMKQDNSRKAAVVILVSNKISEKILSKIIMKHQFSKVWHHMAKIICVSVNNIDIMENLNIFRITSFFGFLDFVIVSPWLQKVEITTLDLATGKLLTHNGSFNVDKVFPDQLKNLSGYKYRIVVYNQPPLVIIQNHKLQSYLVHFLNAIAAVQKTSINYIILDHSSHIKDYWAGRNMDLTLNTAFTYPNSPFQKLLTYEETAYCALVPVNTKHESHELFLFQPFSCLIWMLLILTIILCVTVWRIFHDRGAVDFHWHVGAAITAAFINQDMQFSNRNHPVLNILFHLIIFLIFVLSNAYEGAITSSLIQPAKEFRLETFEQILASKYEIMTDKIFTEAVKDSQDFLAAKSRINSSMKSLGQDYGTIIKEQQYVFVLKCDQAEHELKRQFSNGRKISDYYYLLSERIMKSFIRLEASHLNPYIERLQYYMDLSFQAGLTQIWKRLSPQDVINYRAYQDSNEQDLLDLESIKIVFGILFMGLLASGLILLIEIFYQNCISNINWSNLRRRLRNRVYQMAYKDKDKSVYSPNKVSRLRSRNLKVRRINVMPIIPEV